MTWHETVSNIIKSTDYLKQVQEYVTGFTNLQQDIQNYTYNDITYTDSTSGCSADVQVVVCPYCGHLVDPHYPTSEHSFAVTQYGSGGVARYVVAQCNVIPTTAGTWTTGNVSIGPATIYSYPPLPEWAEYPEYSPPTQHEPVAAPLPDPVPPRGRRHISVEALPDD